MKKRLPAIIAVIVIIAGLSLLLYPSLSDYIHSIEHRRVIAQYENKVQELDSEDYEEILNAAIQYNKRLAARSSSMIALSDEERQDYEAQLDIAGNGVMGHIEIPSIDVSLPIYHGTSDTVLQIGVGHLEPSSLPVGGESVHTILSGHRGLPSAKLFTDIAELQIGDIFSIKVLNEILTYEVDKIDTILPTELQYLRIEEGQDYCTLMTCTPYGVNTHRLLIRGHRVPTPVDANGVDLTQTEAKITDTVIVLAVALVAVLILYIIVSAIYYRKKR